MSTREADVRAGQAVYTRRVLRAYDFIVLGFSSRFVWKSPARRVLEHYNACVSANHLDIGVGTGYFLDRCRFPSASPRVVLMDLNPNSLEYASRRIARYAPESRIANVLEPMAADMPRFDSVAVNFLLHCLPGTMESKAVVFDHIKDVMNSGAVVFGSTLLHGGVERSAVARWLMNVYNRKKIFSNRHDTLDELRRVLCERFSDVSVETVGCAALFSAR